MSKAETEKRQLQEKFTDLEKVNQEIAHLFFFYKLGIYIYAQSLCRARTKKITLFGELP